MGTYYKHALAYTQNQCLSSPGVCTHRPTLQCASRDCRTHRHAASRPASKKPQEKPEKWVGDQPFYPGFRYRDNQRETLAGEAFPPDLLNAGDYRRPTSFCRDRHPDKEVHVVEHRWRRIPHRIMSVFVYVWEAVLASINAVSSNTCRAVVQTPLYLFGYQMTRF